MNELALYAGVGGGILGGLLCGFKPICAVEINSYCREVLLQRQKDGVLPLFPIWDDVKTFDGRIWNGEVDIITAGFPCQPFSIAGKNKGESDERNMWPDTIRIICEVRPSFAFLENVPGLLVHPYFGTILGDLAESGYDCQWLCLGADDVGANHRRKRVWILAYNNSIGGRIKQIPWEELQGKTNAVNNGKKKFVAESTSQGLEREWERTRPRTDGFRQSSWWSVEPKLGRVVHGVPNRIHRLKGLGNAQVPLSMAYAFHKLFERYLEQASSVLVMK